jgi:hypothetical protein
MTTASKQRHDSIAMLSSACDQRVMSVLGGQDALMMPEASCFVPGVQGLTEKKSSANADDFLNVT